MRVYRSVCVHTFVGGCSRFRSWQYQMAFQEGYKLKTAHIWWLYSAAQPGNQATSTTTQYLTQSHYPDTELTSPCSIIVMPSTKLGSNKC